MDDGNITWLWIAAGGLLVLLETIIPGGVVVFVGIAAVLVGLARLMGWWLELVPAFTAFFMLSIAILILFRKVTTKFIQGEISWQSPDEDAAAFGAVVDITETVSEGPDHGRIHFHGTTWPATCLSGTILKGRKARIVARDNMIWIVEPLEGELRLSMEEKEL